MREEWYAHCEHCCLLQLSPDRKRETPPSRLANADAASLWLSVISVLSEDMHAFGTVVEKKVRLENKDDAMLVK